MKLHSVGWFSVICRQAVITLSGLYCSVPSEMKREEREREEWRQRTDEVKGRMEPRREKYYVPDSSLQQPCLNWCRMSMR